MDVSAVGDKCPEFEFCTSTLVLQICCGFDNNLHKAANICKDSARTNLQPGLTLHLQPLSAKDLQKSIM